MTSSPGLVLVLAAMLVPVGIAYAVASGLPGIYGLYATLVPLLAYAVFGPSRILVLGPNSALAALILAVVLQQSGGDPMHAVALAGALDLAENAGVAVLGALPQGLPAFAIPWITWHDLDTVVIGGLAVALVSFADTSVLSRVYAVRSACRAANARRALAQAVNPFLGHHKISRLRRRTPCG
jgi:MFS superfamily sulfate permease-like transporter